MTLAAMGLDLAKSLISGFSRVSGFVQSQYHTSAKTMLAVAPVVAQGAPRAGCRAAFSDTGAATGAMALRATRGHALPFTAATNAAASRATSRGDLPGR